MLQSRLRNEDNTTEINTDIIQHSIIIYGQMSVKEKITAPSF
jgi:hypothetical protein